MQHVKKTSPDLSVTRQCALLGLNRSGLYYRPKTRQDSVTLMNELRDLNARHPTYGYRKAHALLVQQGWRLNRKRVYRLWKEQDLSALYPKKRTTLPGKKPRKYPYLLKDLAINRPNQVWQTDITYLKMGHGYAYLMALIDVHSRYVVGWTLSNSMDTRFCLRAFEAGTARGVYPEIVNTDQGSQFTSDEWVYALRTCGIQVSMTGKGRCQDNIFIERFWRTLKYEEVYLKSYETLAEAREAIGGFIAFYNQERLHQSLGYAVPAAVYFEEKSPNPRPEGDVDNATAFPTFPQAQQQPLSYLDKEYQEDLVS